LLAAAVVVSGGVYTNGVQVAVMAAVAAFIDI